jgi:hypothetical protein
MRIVVAVVRRIDLGFVQGSAEDEKAYLRAKAPFPGGPMRPKVEALGYLFVAGSDQKATATTKATAEADSLRE